MKLRKNPGNGIYLLSLFRLIKAKIELSIGISRPGIK